MVVLCPMGMVDLPLMASAAGIRWRLGYRNAVRGNLYTHPCDTDYTKGEGELNLDLACRAGGKRAAGRPFVAVGGPDRERVDRLLAENEVRGDELLIALHPGSSEMKRWPKERFAALADLLMQDRRARILLVGGPGERELCGEVARMMKSPPIVAAGLLTIKQTADLIGRCDLFVGNDSGPMHLAAALATPTIGLFGPTDRVKNRPWGPRNRIVIIGGGMKCAPCYKNGEIPCIYDTNRCMAEISVNDVYERARSLLAGGTAPRRNRKAAG
jgi:heptosyltransferase-2